jgi:type I restriction enzyme S subunit
MTDKIHGAKTLVGYKRFHPGQIVMNRMQAWSGMFGAGAISGLVSPDYAVFDVIGGHESKFLLDLLKTPKLVGQFALASRGIGSGFNRLYTDRFGPIPIPLPPHDEQSAIVRFLHFANWQIDRTIRAKKRLIALLNEQKQTIIHHAVTRGLDSNLPLKPSGISWLGDLPRHWDLRRLKTFAQFVTSGSRGWARYYSDTGPVFLRIGNISTTDVDLKLSRITHVTPPIDAEGERTRVQENDVLLSITAQIGAVGIVPPRLGEAYVNQHTALIRLKQTGCRPRWVAYCLLSEFGKRQCQLRTNGGTKLGLTLDDVRTLQIMAPPDREQADILDHIEGRTRDLKTAITRTEREIGLLREYRTRLIADVVTGQVDVRGVSIPDIADIKLEKWQRTEPIPDEPTDEVITENDEQ